MPDNTYKLIEIVGVSDQGVSQAIRNGVARAARTLRGLDWFEVTEVRGVIKDGAVAAFQVKMKIGFRLMSNAELEAEGELVEAQLNLDR